MSEEGREQAARAAASQGSSNRAPTLEAADIFLAATEGLVEEMRVVRWDGGQSLPLVPVLSRATICRQHDYLGAAAQLARQGRGWAVVPLLRPACEELIWLSVLAKVEDGARERIIAALAALNFVEDLRAQDRFHGRAAMIELGFDPSVLSRSDEQRRQLRAALRTEFAALGLAKGRSTSLPSVAVLADRADLRRLYDFIYHATSTAVHFKPGQLLRGVWGEPGDMRIDLVPIEGRLADFGIYWGVRLVLDTFVVALPLAGGDEISAGLDREGIERSARMLAGGERPFILPDELAWPEA
jgi:hypothetical protein